jgi:hypothetical protein
MLTRGGWELRPDFLAAFGKQFGLEQDAGATGEAQAEEPMYPSQIPPGASSMRVVEAGAA